MDGQEAPTTVKEVGIHIAYMRKDIHDVKALMTNIANNFTPKEDHAELVKRVEDLETDRDELRGAVNILKALVAVLTAVAAVIGGLWWVRA